MPGDPVPSRPRRVLVAGTTGAGKTTLAARVAEVLHAPHIEIDALYHGPNWTPRPTFEADVDRFTSMPSWVTEWQYDQVRAMLAERADLLIWLDVSRSRVMWQIMRRTLRRRLRRQALWNGNVEPPLSTILTDPEHVVRWAWSTHHDSAVRVATLHAQRPELTIVRLTSPRAARRWLDGALRRSWPAWQCSASPDAR